MENMIKDFSPETASIFRQVLDADGGLLAIRHRGGNYVIESRWETAAQYDLTLLEAFGLPENCDGWSLWPGELRRTGEGYALPVSAEDPERGDDLEATLTFTGAEGRAWAVRPDAQMMHLDPWTQLGVMTSGIVWKGRSFPELLNAREREWMPLLLELCILNHWNVAGASDFPELKKRFPPELHARLDRLPTDDCDRFSRNVYQFLGILNRQKYGDLWWSLWQMVAWTQEEYPEPHTGESAPEPEITAYLRQQGYQGQWPNYHKRGTLQNNRWVRTNRRRYPVKKGSEAVFYIRFCPEEADFSIHCATELTDGADPRGFDFCRYACGGRRFVDTVHSRGPLEERLAIAVKKAELLPLTREERKTDGVISPLAVFFWTFLLAGGIGAVFFTIGMALLTLALALLFVGPGGISLVFTAGVWLQVFAGSWLLSGGVVGAILACLSL